MSENNNCTLYKPNTLYEKKAVYCTDVVEFCPYKGYENLYVIGTYEVLESGGNVISEKVNDDQENNTYTIDIGNPSNKDSNDNSIKRTGRLLFQRLDAEEEDSKNKIKISKIMNINAPAIFDLKWSYQKIKDTGYLGMADAVGNVTILKLVNDGTNFNLEKVANTENPTDELCCSLDWSNRIGNTTNIVVSRSNGYITLYEFGDNDLKQLDHWKAHTLEAWVAAFDQWNPNVIYTGADDCLFKGYDTRIGTSMSTFVNKQHDAGVCTVQVNPHNENILATGSYDNYLNIWDKRKMTRPLIHYYTDGGVWKVKWHPKPEKKNYIAAACMYNGFHIYDINLESAGDDAITEICTYDKHQSIAYGIDWCLYNNNKCPNQIVGTCSFYDHLFHIWEMEQI